MSPAREASKLSRQIQPMLKGRAPEIQGAVLADLVSIWLLGHLCDAAHVNDLREEMLTEFIALVRDLVKVNSAAIRAGMH